MYDEFYGCIFIYRVGQKVSTVNITSNVNMKLYRDHLKVLSMIIMFLDKNCFLIFKQDQLIITTGHCNKMDLHHMHSKKCHDYLYNMIN